MATGWTPPPEAKVVDPNASAAPKPWTPPPEAKPVGAAAPASTAPAGSGWSAFGEGLLHGLGNLFYGSAQVGAHMGPEEGSAAFADPADLAARQKTVDETVTAREKAYADDPARKAHPYLAGTGNIAGEIAATAPLFAAGGIPETLFGRVVASTIPGTLTALSSPVDTSRKTWGQQKAWEVPVGAVATALGVPAGELIGKGIGWGVQAVGDLFRDSATVATRKAAEAEAKATAKAGKRISETVAEGEKGGGPTAVQIKQDIEEARKTGQPYALVDAGPTETERLAGTAYRSPGGAGTRMKTFQKERTTEFGEERPMRTAQTQRIANWIHNTFGTESAKKAGERLATERSAAATPLYEKAFEGGSLAPLEHQFGQEFDAASKAETLAAQRVAEARTKLTPILARQSQAGNVYSAAAANPEARAAAGELATAEAELAQARQFKESVRARLQQAQADGTANAKGAVWSPRLQQFIDDPDIKQGLRHGAKLERDRALADDRPFNPSEYAIVGTDENGEPIVGAVPNMKLLQKGKEALDARLFGDNSLRDKFGRKTEEWWVLDRKRRAYVKELDRLNPDYKAAREAWAEGSAMMESTQFGKEALADLRSGHLTVEEMTERWNDFSASEREVFKLALGDQLVIDLDRARTTGTPANAIINSNAGRELVRTLFGSNSEFDTFMRFLGREQRMSDVGHKVMSGSPSAERLESTARELNRLDAAHHMVETIRRVRHLDPRAAASLWRAVQAVRGGSKDEAYNRKLMEMLTNPDIELSVGPDGQLLVGPQVSQSRGLLPTVGGPVGGDIGALITQPMTYSAPPSFSPGAGQ